MKKLSKRMYPDLKYGDTVSIGFQKYVVTEMMPDYYVTKEWSRLRYLFDRLGRRIKRWWHERQGKSQKLGRGLSTGRRNH